MSRWPLPVVAALLAAAVVLGIRAAAWEEREASHLSDWHLWTETDEHAAVAAAARIAGGNWLDAPAFRPWFSWQARFGSPADWDAVVPRNVAYQGPAYPYFLVVAGATGQGQVMVARLAQLLLATIASGVLSAACAALLLRAGRGRSLALVAGVSAGVLHGTYGPLVFLDGFLYRDGPIAHLSALLLAIPLLGSRAPRVREGLGLGLLAGAGALVKQTLLPLGLLAGACLALRAVDRSSRRRVVAGLAAGLLVALSPLLVRNSLVGDPLLSFDTRPLVGIPWANARGADGSVNTSPLLMDVLRKARGSTLRAAVETLATWRGDPLGFPLLVGRKLASAVNGVEVPDNASFGFFRDRLPWLSRLPLFAFVFGPGVAGLILAARRGLFRRREAFLVAGAGVVPLAACVLVSTTTRYRAGAAAPLALGTALLGALAVEAFRARQVRPLLPYLATAAVLSAQTLLPSPIRARPNRWSDTIVAATLAEARTSPEAGAAEIRRYLEEQGEDPDRTRGLMAMQRWLAGDRAISRVEPAGIAPPERRYQGTRR
ncbi:MAG: hypothetical protein IPN83_09680 [Holophagales bacterium]|nr:hypothetical protein [Holophagales bacterium]